MARTTVGCEMRWSVCATLVLLIHAGCSAQTLPTSSLPSPESDRPTVTTEVTRSSPLRPKPFDGEWGVAWCDKSDPKADCGGFNLGLFQKGNRLCGTYDGARARLSQVDEGGRVLGTTNGESAVLTVEGERSGGKYVAHAVIDGERLHWKLAETIRAADRDIGIIAIDERLDRRALQGDVASKHAEIASDCQAQFGETSDRLSTVPTDVTGSSSLQTGEYATEKGWGQLQLKNQGGMLTFAIESLIGEDYCTLNGTIRGDQGIATDDHGPSRCTVKFASSPEGIDVTANTSALCKTFCGHNGDFEGLYLKIKDECGRGNRERARKEFRRLYEAKYYKAALATLSPVLTSCQRTLAWEEEGDIRNDLAITQYRNGLHAECLATLDKYAEDAEKDDNAVIDGWTPVLAERYLAIIRAARTNIGFCSRNVKDRGDRPFDGEWGVTWCDKSKPEADCGGFNLGLVQMGNRLCGAYDSARARLSQIDEGGRVLGTVKGDSAVLTIESERSGGKYVAHATLDGNQLHWRLGETTRMADRDIDIIAIDESLDRRSLQGDLALKHAEIASDCQLQRGNEQEPPQAAGPK